MIHMEFKIDVEDCANCDQIIVEKNCYGVCELSIVEDGFLKPMASLYKQEIEQLIDCLKMIHFNITHQEGNEEEEEDGLDGE